MSRQNVYSRIIERIILARFKAGMREVEFEREDIARVARQLGLARPKNLGDVVYSMRHRTPMPISIQSKAGKGQTWIIRGIDRAKYQFVVARTVTLAPNKSLAITKVPDSTPGIVAKYALGDEQAVLAKLRYNRLVDVFTGVTCYSLQNHLRTTVPQTGQVETDELYVGVDKRGVHYAFPVQAKGGTDKLSVVQIEQDLAVCALKFPKLLCRPIGAQFMNDDVIAMFEFEHGEDGIRVASEKHYSLAPPRRVTNRDLARYRLRTLE